MLQRPLVLDCWRPSEAQSQFFHIMSPWHRGVAMRRWCTIDEASWKHHETSENMVNHRNFNPDRLSGAGECSYLSAAISALFLGERWWHQISWDAKKMSKKHWTRLNQVSTVRCFSKLKTNGVSRIGWVWGRSPHTWEHQNASISTVQCLASPCRWLAS